MLQGKYFQQVFCSHQLLFLVLGYVPAILGNLHTTYQCDNWTVLQQNFDRAATPIPSY